MDDQMEIAFDLHNNMVVVTAMAVDIHNQVVYHMDIEQGKEGVHQKLTERHQDSLDTWYQVQLVDSQDTGIGPSYVMVVTLEEMDS